jgi:hypothetical protein
VKTSTNVGQPDLVVTNLSPLSVDAVAASAEWPFSATVTNQGDGIAAASTLRFSVSNPSTGIPVNVDARVASLGAGQSVTVTVDNLSARQLSRLGIGSGKHIITAIADADKEVAESNESNNQYSQSATLPVFYSRVIVDTYNALLANANGFYPGVDALDFYDSSMQLLAFDHSGNSMDGDNSGFASIDYDTSNPKYSKPLPPGPYFIMITVRPTETTGGDYAIRVMDAPDVSLPRDPTWYPNTTGDAFEPDGFNADGTPKINPDSKITIGGKLQRSLSDASDVDWVVLTLP